jgi:hypothetical protein
MDKKFGQFKIIHMPPDGSCLFHSICYAVYGNYLYSYEIREKIVKHILIHRTKFQILTQDAKGDNYLSANSTAMKC